MKKTFQIFFLLFLLIFTVSNEVEAGSNTFKVKINNKTQYVNKVAVNVNGSNVKSEFAPYALNNRTFVPIREITENMGAKVDWNQKSQSVKITLNNQEVILKINSNIAYINGNKKTLNRDSIPTLTYYVGSNSQNKTMVPLRFLSETLGFTVEWNQSTQTANIANLYPPVPTQPVEKASIQPQKSQGSTVAQNTVSKNSNPNINQIPAKAQVTIKQPQSNLTPTSTTKSKSSVKTVVLDPGHGGKDSGAIAIDNTFEKDLALEVALKTEALLKANGFNVIMTRSRDEYLSLANRAQIANDIDADIFISVHFNSASNPSANGIEVLYASEEAVPTKSEGQKLLAQEINAALKRETGMKSRGLKHRPEIAVLRRTNMSSALVELGFLSNPDDLDTIHKDGFADQCARGIVKGIQSYVNKYM